MKKLPLLLFCSAIMAGLVSCGSSPRTTVATNDEYTDSMETREEVEDYRFDYTDTRLGHDFAYTTTHNFSSTESRDKFTFYVPDGFIKQTNAILVIQRENGDTLFADTLHTEYLINPDDLASIEDDDAMTAYIESQAKNILYDGPFIDPNRTYALDFFSGHKDGIDDQATLDEHRKEGRDLFRMMLMGNNATFWGYSAQDQKVKIIYSD